MTRQAVKMLLIVLLVNTTIIRAQSRREIREMFYEAESWLLFEEYKEALPLYLKLLEINPENYNYKYRTGICYLNIPGEKEKALPYLQDAVMHTNPDYKEGKFRETEAPYDALFFLADCYRISAQLDKALETYRTFYREMDTEVYDTLVVQQHIEACLNAKKLIQSPLYVRQENQGELINSIRSDVNPVVSADEKTIAFTRQLPFYKGIFYSKKSDGMWMPPVQIQEELLIDDGHTTSLSPDGNELYIYRDDGYEGNLYMSRYSDGRWSPAVKLNDNINTKYWESHASISGDGQKLYFTSNRKGGYGGLDIYVSEKDSTGQWGPAMNLGPEINTPFNEETPFIDITGNVLYFSSRGHMNMGGYDIFYSTIREDGKWSATVNMAYPVNTTDDDVFFSPVGKGYIAYMSQFDPEAYGREDIYRLEVFSNDHPRTFSVRGMVKLKDLLSHFKDSVRISALNKLSLDTLVAVYSDPQTGRYEFEIPHGQYKLVYDSYGSEKVEEDLDLALTHPSDIIDLPEQEMGKTDLIADLRISAGRDSVSYMPGDTVSIELEIEPRSLLTVEHWQNDQLVNTDEYFINDPVFVYDAQALAGDNTLRFEIQDRFNNITTEDYNFFASVPLEVQAEISEPLIEEPDEIQEGAREATLDSLDLIHARETESIDRMGQVISEVSTDDDTELIKDAIRKINERRIKKAGEWLESLYSVAIEDGAEKELLTRLIAAMSAEAGDDARDYIRRLSEFASPALKEILDKIDISELEDDSPEGIIEFLLSNAEKYAYSKEEVFEALSKLINTSGKTAEDIVSYLSIGKGQIKWGLWILLGALAIALIIVGKRRKKKKKD
ncbi:MAG: PD40 domain-containing protein [Bacteroidales bacterium]|nr:PD40 domain-containing protein [Bacteroidales bacterium]